MNSPTQRTLALLRKEGYLAQVVEHWNPHALIRKDLFGFGDVMAIAPGKGILMVQATSSPTLSARVNKMLNLPSVPIWLGAGDILEAGGWAKTGPRGKVKHWTVRRIGFHLDGNRLPLALEKPRA